LTAFDLFCYGYGVVFVALHIMLTIGIFREWLWDRRSGVSLQLGKNEKQAGHRVSLIIPIHNESCRIEGLLRSLLAQDFPAEIIFVDDRSDDGSPAMLAQFAKDAAQLGQCASIYGGKHDCRVITLAENPGPNYKQHALSVGIAESHGDYLLFTDGDCEAPPGWISAMVSRMNDPRVGAVIGPVFKKKQGRGFFALYQCFDHVIRCHYLIGATGLGAAGGGFGNNLIVSRAALDSVGGYDALPPSPTEDAALISLIRSQGAYRVRAIAMPDAAVETSAEKTWRDFINQTLRWNNGGLFSPDPVTRFNYAFLMITISMGIVTVPLLPFIPSIWPLPVGVLTSMTFNTIANLVLFRISLPRRRFAYILTLLFTPVYFTFLTALGFLGIKPKWKGETV